MIERDSGISIVTLGDGDVVISSHRISAVPTLSFSPLKLPLPVGAMTIPDDLRNLEGEVVIVEIPSLEALAVLKRQLEFIEHQLLVCIA